MYTSISKIFVDMDLTKQMNIFLMCQGYIYQIHKSPLLF